jgi:hypothetical protein
VEGDRWFSPPQAVSDLIRWTPLTLGSSAFCCVRVGQEGDVPESRRHRLAVQVELGVFSEVCGHLYVAAGLWSAKQRLGEFEDGVAVLKICISCHIHQPSPVEATTSSQLGSILHLHSKAMPMALWHVSLLSYAHATNGTQTKGRRCPSDEVGHSRKVARTNCLPLQAPSCPRACRSPPARIDPS